MISPAPPPEDAYKVNSLILPEKSNRLADSCSRMPAVLNAG